MYLWIIILYRQAIWTKSGHARIASLSFEFSLGIPQVYNVDMHAMYVVPLVVIICVAALVLLAFMRDHPSLAGPSHGWLVAILTYPVSANSSRSVKGLFFGFMLFAVLWCIWTSPLWLNLWENHATVDWATRFWGCAMNVRAIISLWVTR